MRLNLIFVSDDPPNQINETLIRTFEQVCSENNIDFTQATIAEAKKLMNSSHGNTMETLFVIQVPEVCSEDELHEGYFLAEELNIPPRRRKFYTQGQPQLEDIKNNHGLELSLSEYISPHLSPEIDKVHLQQWINYALAVLEREKALIQKEKALSVGQSLRHTLGTSLKAGMKKLEKYKEKHEDFQIPISLNFIAWQALLVSGELNSDEMNRFFSRLPGQENLSENGFSEEIVELLTGENCLARDLAEARLANDGIFPKQLKSLRVQTSGNISAEYLGLCSEIQIGVFIAILVFLLKDAIEHTQRYLINNSNSAKQNLRNTIEVYVKNNSKIYVKNPCLDDVQPLTEQSNQKKTLDILTPHLEPIWRVQNPKIQDGSWIRCLAKEN